jgi:hypothetical protein
MANANYTIEEENYTGARQCALVLGIIFTLIGVAGFFPVFMSLPGANASYVPADLAPGAYSAGFGNLFGIFPTNFFHNIIHCAVGLFGMAASRDGLVARTYDRVFAYAYAGIALLGLIPLTNNFFGLMPIFGNNVWFNALTAVIAAYFGFIKPSMNPANTSFSRQMTDKK